ncbi:MAG TPA: ankyrin repeat domain-containing protein [Tepidisphaeraceae bacterium]|jgi:ankyrin repeat protein|nr:ankyrin repeat domain-containing protein [Tepidisphaeraceae bacterium]
MSIKDIERRVPAGRQLPALFQRFIDAGPPFEIEWNSLKNYALKKSATETAVPFLRLYDGGLLALWYKSKSPAVVHIGAHGDWGVVAETFDDFLKAVNNCRTGLSDIDERDEDQRFVIAGIKGKPATEALPALYKRFAAWLKKHAGADAWADLETDISDLSQRMNDPKLQKKLFAAIESADAATITKLLNANPGLVNEHIKLQGAPLAIAAATKNLELVKLLLEKGADPNLKASRYAVMWNIVGSDDLEIVKFLVSRGARVRGEMQEGETALFNAQSTEMVQFLLDQGVDAKATDKYGGTALHRMAAWCRTDAARLLLDAGTNIAACDIFNVPAIWNAVETCVDDPTDLLDLLLERGAKLDGRNEAGDTLLHKAAGGTLGAVKWLVARKADPNAKNNEGKTPLDRANELLYNPHSKEIAAYLTKLK